MPASISHAISRHDKIVKLFTLLIKRCCCLSYVVRCCLNDVVLWVWCIFTRVGFLHFKNVSLLCEFVSQTEMELFLLFLLTACISRVTYVSNLFFFSFSLANVNNIAFHRVPCNKYLPYIINKPLLAACENSKHVSKSTYRS